MILEGIHFLHHNVGVGAHPARKQCSLLQDGSADFAVVIGGEDAMGLHLDPLPEGGVRRQQIARAFHRTNWFDSIRHFVFES
jgi:hypothetical protein